MTILDQIKEHHAKTGGHCGLYITDFIGEKKAVRNKLNDLYRERKIVIRDGAQGKLIFYNFDA